ncbi:MAG TPA: DMT family transporter [Sulfurimonas autotrophica]|nr:DMT family transporter [Sulfurimonas autotrophica]
MKKVDSGVLFMLGSAVISALNGALTKILSEDISALEIIFFRNLIGVFIILSTLKHTALKLIGGNIYLLFIRGIFGFMAMILFFYTITVIPLGEAITLNKTSPFFVTLLAYFLLYEDMSKRTLFALLIGFFGVVLITKPFGMNFSYVHFLGILGGFFAAAAYTTIKKIKDMYESRMIMLSFVGMGTFLPALLFLIAPFIKVPASLDFLFPEFLMPQSLDVWLFIVVMAIISTLSQWLLTKVYSAKNLSVIGVVSYTNIPFAIGFGYMLGDNFPDMLTIMGIIFIIFGGILVSRKSQVKS